MPKKINEEEVAKLKAEFDELRKRVEQPVIKREVKEEKELWGVGEVPTQYTPTIINTKTGESIDLNSVLAKILNNQEKMLKSLG